MKSKKIIVITGSIATGKSAVTNLLKNHDYEVVDADKIAHRLMQIGEPNYKKIVDNFGENILDENKNIDRKKLGSIVFNDSNKLQELSELTHQNIFLELNKEYRKVDRDIVFLDIPLLFETFEFSKRFLKIDEIWLVYTPFEIQISRLMKRDNISEEIALKKIKSQIKIEEKILKSDFVIDNSRDFDYLKKQVLNRLGEI